jgi:hypothetical protein
MPWASKTPKASEARAAQASINVFTASCIASIPFLDAEGEIITGDWMLQINIPTNSSDPFLTEMEHVDPLFRWRIRYERDQLSEF